MGVPQRQLGAKVDKEQEQESLADVLLPHWVGGKDAALDVTVVNPCQAATVVGAATTVGHALRGRASLFCPWWWNPLVAGNWKKDHSLRKQAK